MGTDLKKIKFEEDFKFKPEEFRNKNSLIDEELNLLVKAGGTLLIAAIKRKEI